ncbi:MAG: hypothetical protein RSC76_02580 [Oscillospiraceae bacterium]
MKNQQETRSARILKALVVALVFLALSTVTFFTFRYYLTLHEARVTLYEAKTAQLAAWSVSTKCYATNSLFSDSTTPSGFTEAAEKEILALSQAEGKIRLLQVGKNGYDILSMLYIDEEYVVFYRSDGETGSWEVYKGSALITA